MLDHVGSRVKDRARPPCPRAMSCYVHRAFGAWVSSQFSGNVAYNVIGVYWWPPEPGRPQELSPRAEEWKDFNIQEMGGE